MRQIFVILQYSIDLNGNITTMPVVEPVYFTNIKLLHDYLVKHFSDRPELTIPGYRILLNTFKSGSKGSYTMRSFTDVFEIYKCEHAKETELSYVML